MSPEMVARLTALLDEYVTAKLPQEAEKFSPIEAMRREQRMVKSAMEGFDLLMRADIRQLAEVVK